jgi:hypothetical protein
VDATAKVGSHPHQVDQLMHWLAFDMYECCCTTRDESSKEQARSTFVHGNGNQNQGALCAKP